MGDALTLRDLRHELDEEKHIISYAIDRYGPEPAGRIGTSRIWTKDQLPQIRQSLDRTRIHSSLKERRAAPATV